MFLEVSERSEKIRMTWWWILEGFLARTVTTGSKSKHQNSSDTSVLFAHVVSQQKMSANNGSPPAPSVLDLPSTGCNASLKKEADLGRETIRRRIRPSP